MRLGSKKRSREGWTVEQDQKAKLSPNAEVAHTPPRIREKKKQEKWTVQDGRNGRNGEKAPLGQEADYREEVRKAGTQGALHTRGQLLQKRRSQEVERNGGIQRKIYSRKG